MIFNSLPFLIFITIFFIFWPLARKNNNTKYLYINFFSVLFYAWWSWKFLFLIFATGLFDFSAAILIVKYPFRKKIFLWTALSVNILAIAIFKYFYFIVGNIEFVFHLFSLPTVTLKKITSFDIILPIGISFYTFQSMNYVIDVYRDKLKPTFNIMQYFAFIFLFPHLVAGPIVRAKEMLKQLAFTRNISTFEIWNGIKLIIIGYFQKVVLADNIAVIVNYAYEGVHTYNSIPYWWTVSIAFGLQIYFDFNGYTSIARGIAKLMGLHFRMNFNYPYFSTSIQEFWQRWHISLSTWFRDYVYISLGGSRRGKFRSHLNMWITMLISGLWHGANFTFIFWGAIHAFYLSFERLVKWKSIKIHPFIKWCIIMFTVLITWVFFRAKSISQAFRIIKSLFVGSLDFSFSNSYSNSIKFICIGLILELLIFIKQRYSQINFLTKKAYFEIPYYSLMIWMILFFTGPQVTFIYFQF